MIVLVLNIPLVIRYIFHVCEKKKQTRLIHLLSTVLRYSVTKTNSFAIFFKLYFQKRENEAKEKELNQLQKF